MAFENRTYAVVNAAEFQQAVDEGRIDVGVLFEKVLEKWNP